MNKTVLVIILVLVIAAGLYFFVRGRLASPTVEINPDTEKILQKTRPIIPTTEETYLSLLEQNAVSGGPPKDGIPAIGAPKYINREEADAWLLPNDVVFGIDYENFVVAYPQRILVWHEIVNETIAGENISVTYCPLTGTAIGFKGKIAPELNSTFGVSGKLVNSNLIMYDRATDSYWPQILGKAINGPSKGIALEEFPIVWTTWERWKSTYPETLVLSQQTGFFRDYGEGGDPYGSYLQDNKGYYSSDRTIFRPIYEDDRLRPKEVVVGIRDADGNALAILKDRLRAEGVVEVSLGEDIVVVTYNEALDFYEARLKNTDEWINAFDAMWFAWFAFYPDTELIK